MLLHLFVSKRPQGLKCVKSRHAMTRHLRLDSPPSIDISPLHRRQLPAHQERETRWILSILCSRILNTVSIKMATTDRHRIAIFGRNMRNGGNLKWKNGVTTKSSSNPLIWQDRRKRMPRDSACTTTCMIFVVAIDLL